MNEGNHSHRNALDKTNLQFINYRKYQISADCYFSVHLTGSYRKCDMLLLFFMLLINEILHFGFDAFVLKIDN